MLEERRAAFQNRVLPIVRRLAGLGVAPSTLTWAALALSAGAAVLLYLAEPAAWYLLPVAGGVLGVVAILDGLDGALARATGSATPEGDLLDHVTDRYADVFILTALTLNPGLPAWPGVLAITGTLLTSYMGTQAQALGLGRLYAGVFNRADRFLFFFLGLPAAGILWLYRPEVNLLTPLLVLYGGLAHVTALQRAWEIRHRLDKRRATPAAAPPAETNE